MQTFPDILRRASRFLYRHRLLTLVIWTALVVLTYSHFRTAGPDFWESEKQACKKRCAPLSWKLETLRQERAFQNSPRPAHKYPECICY